MAFIDIADPHNWTNLNKTYPYLFMSFWSDQEADNGGAVLPTNLIMKRMTKIFMKVFFNKINKRDM